MRVCTIVAANYLPYARVLARSVRAAHPGCEVDVLVVDAPPALPRQDDGMRLLTTLALALPTASVHQMAGMYDVTEFATALKPWLLEALLHESAESVVYLDPDIRVYAPLDPVLDAVAETGLALTPHTTTPMVRDGLRPNEQDILMSGTYNLGFVAVDRRALPFLRWWQERLRWDCLHDVANGLFVDQRWVDLAVHYFPYSVVRDEGCNVAYWNVDRRPLSRDGAVLRAGKTPLRFFHFSGYRPENPHVLSRHHLSASRLDPRASQVLEELCRSYSAELASAGYSAAGLERYAYDVSADGVLLSKPVRRRYREAGLRGDPLPDPFDPTAPSSFRRWARRARSPQTWVAARLPASGGVVVKALEDPRRAAEVLGQRARRRLPSRSAPAARQPALGASVVGYFRAEDGVGQGARALVACLERAGIPHTTTTNRRTPSPQGASFEEVSGQDYPIDIVCVNADMLAETLSDLSRRRGRASYTIGVWAWELAVFPERMRGAAALVDEIWTLSHHSAAAIAPVVDKPVLVFPYPVLTGRPAERARAELGVPEGFVFLFCFDVRSGLQRKNPHAVVRSFILAFSPEEGPRLVIKVANAEADPAGVEALVGLAKGRSDVSFHFDHVPAEEQLALMAACDCYVSLHRAEGLGLTMAEAMSYAKPVIATGYSGNLEFMTVANSYLVPYELVPVLETEGPYAGAGSWAEPDVAVAADLMRRVVAKPEEAAARGARAARDMVTTMSPDSRVPFLMERLQRAAARVGLSS